MENKGKYKKFNNNSNTTERKGINKHNILYKRGGGQNIQNKEFHPRLVVDTKATKYQIRVLERIQIYMDIRYSQNAKDFNWNRWRRIILELTLSQNQ